MLPKNDRLAWLTEDIHQRGDRGASIKEPGFLRSYQDACGQDCTQRLLSNDMAQLFREGILRRTVVDQSRTKTGACWVYRYFHYQKPATLLVGGSLWPTKAR